MTLGEVHTRHPKLCRHCRYVTVTLERGCYQVIDNSPLCTPIWGIFPLTSLASASFNTSWLIFFF